MNTIELEEEEFVFVTEDPSSQSAVESSQFRLIHVEEKDSGDGRKVIELRSRSSVQFYPF